MRLAHENRIPVWHAKLIFPMREFLSWQAYERICPFDLDAARICTAVYLGAGAKGVDIMDFTLFGRGEKSQVNKDKMMQSAANSGAARTYKRCEQWLPR